MYSSKGHILLQGLGSAMIHDNKITFNQVIIGHISHLYFVIKRNAAVKKPKMFSDRLHWHRLDKNIVECADDNNFIRSILIEF